MVGFDHNFPSSLRDFLTGEVQVSSPVFPGCVGCPCPQPGLSAVLTMRKGVRGQNAAQECWGKDEEQPCHPRDVLQPFQDLGGSRGEMGRDVQGGVLILSLFLAIQSYLYCQCIQSILPKSSLFCSWQQLVRDLCGFYAEP